MDDILYMMWAIKGIFIFALEKSYNFRNILRKSLSPKCTVWPLYYHYKQINLHHLAWSDLIWIYKITSII